MQNIIIVDQEKFEQTKKRMHEAGVDTFHVLSDFDRTITKGFVDGQRSPTAISQFRNGGYLTADYAPRAFAYYDIYHPIEIDPNISREEKSAKMDEWWNLHFDLLVECGLTKAVIEEVSSKRTLQFRDAALTFLDFLHDKKIPLVIMSAAPGDLIVEYLRQEGRLTDNIDIISNLFIFDEIGKVTGVKKPIIHTLNKYEVVVREFPIFETIKNRKNVVLLGDGLDDVGMIDGFDYDNLIKVGFLNENVEENMEAFKKTYDVIILGDPGMDFVDNLVREIVL
jgi:HAD superfamily hydrolase (TIGR01544 family)